MIGVSATMELAKLLLLVIKKPRVTSARLVQKPVFAVPVIATVPVYCAQ